MYNYLGFEIRIMYKEDTIYYPQDEMTTALLPVTSGCHITNVYLFMYKDDRYYEVPIQI